MPEWFRTLGLITLAVLMVSILLSFSGTIITVAVVAVKDWLENRKTRRR